MTSKKEFEDMLDSAIDLTKECLMPGKKSKYFHPSVFVMYEGDKLSICMVEDGLPPQKRKRMKIMSELGEKIKDKSDGEIKACFLAALAEGQIGNPESEVAVFVVGMTPDGKNSSAVIRIEVTPDNILCAGVTEKNRFSGPLVKDAMQMLQNFFSGKIKKRRGKNNQST